MSEEIVNAIIAGIGSSENATEQAIEVISNLERAGFPARLIAAAPDMLEALQAINRVASPGHRTLDDFIRDMGVACDMARAAVAKATEPRP